MKEVLIPAEEFRSLNKTVDENNKLIRQLIKNKSDLSNKYQTVKQTCKILHISSRTLQKYRDEGILAFSQHGNKILFLSKDIEDHINKNYRPSHK
jgi:hypothetical protein